MASRMCQNLLPLARKKCFQFIYPSVQNTASSVFYQQHTYRSDNACSYRLHSTNYDTGLSGVTVRRGFKTSCQLHHGKVNCWKCGASVQEFKDKFFCKCDVIQEPNESETYFDILGVERTFDLNTSELKTHFRNLQRFLHPDKFTQKSEKEREISALHSSIVNKAYSALLKPIPRGLYMLKLHGYALEEGEIQMASDFLMEIMEINEELADSDSLNAVQTIGKRNGKVLEKFIKEVSGSFQDGDIPRAKELMAKLKYYANIDDKVKDMERKYATHLYT